MLTCHDGHIFGFRAVLVVKKRLVVKVPGQKAGQNRAPRGTTDSVEDTHGGVVQTWDGKNNLPRQARSSWSVSTKQVRLAARHLPLSILPYHSSTIWHAKVQVGRSSCVQNRPSCSSYMLACVRPWVCCDRIGRHGYYPSFMQLAFWKFLLSSASVRSEQQEGGRLSAVPILAILLSVHSTLTHMPTYQAYIHAYFFRPVWFGARGANLHDRRSSTTYVPARFFLLHPAAPSYVVGIPISPIRFLSPVFGSSRCRIGLAASGHKDIQVL
jgi:hypothetical protein